MFVGPVILSLLNIPRVCAKTSLFIPGIRREAFLKEYVAAEIFANMKGFHV